MPVSLVRNRLLPLLCLLVLVLGQVGHAPDRLVVPQAHGLLLGDAGAHIPLVQVRAMQVVARAEIGDAPSERLDLPLLPPSYLHLLVREVSSAGSMPAAIRSVCSTRKGFWACGPPLQLG